MTDAFGNPLDPTQASLSVGDPAVLAVGPAGVLRVLRGLRAGTTTVYVRTSDGIADSVRIRVYAPFRGTAVGVGLGCSCALGEDARAYCWGVRPGTVVPPEGTYRSMPEAVSTSLTFVSIAVGQSHACGLTPAGLAWCWGGNAQGQLGNGNFTSSPTPVPVIGAVRFTRIAAGGLTTCAVTPDARAWCWGSNMNGRLGGSFNPADNVPSFVRGFDVPIDSGRFTRRVQALSVGESHACALAATDAELVTAPGVGAAYCWGETGGWIGTGGSLPAGGVFGAREVAGGLRFAHISAGARRSCALDTAGRAWCWGSTVGAPGSAASAAVPGGTVPTRAFGEGVFTDVHAG